MTRFRRFHCGLPKVRPFAARPAVLAAALFVLQGLAAGSAASAADLTPQIAPGDAALVTVELEVGGELLVTNDEGKNQRLALSADADLQYEELLLGEADGAAPAAGARAVRHYRRASATIKTDQQTVERGLPDDQSTVIVELTPQRILLGGLQRPLSRDHFDLVNAVGNSLVIDRLLPGMKLDEGESWDHEADEIGALLGLQKVTVCKVSSVVEGVEHGKIQLRLAGSVYGYVDGAETKIELKGAYLFDPTAARITKFNLAVREDRNAGLATPGLDVTAKLTMTATPMAAADLSVDAADLQAAKRLRMPPAGEISVDSPQRGYRFRHGADWYVTADQREMLSMRMLQAGDLIAHCNITTLPARAPERATKLKQFEQDIRTSLGKRVDEIAAAKEWTTNAGYNCLAVFANGKVKDVPVQWRYYLVTAENKPRVSVAVTVERSRLSKFADSDRSIVDSLELIEQPQAETAAK